MTKHRWKGSMKAFGDHIDPDKDEQLKWMKIEIGNNAKKILKLAKNINPGNKDGNLKKKGELIHLIEDFTQQYESLYTLYEDLRGEVKKRVKVDDGNSSSSSSSSNSTSDLESYYSPQGLMSSKTSDVSSETSEIHETLIPEPDSKNEEEKTNDFDSRDLKPQEMENVLETDASDQKLLKLKDLEEEVGRLKVEIEMVCNHKSELEELFESKSNEAMAMKGRISMLEAQIQEIEVLAEEKERLFRSMKQRCEDNERDYLDRISGLSEQANGLKLEANALRVQKGELEERLSGEIKKRFDEVKNAMERVNVLEEKLVSVSNQKSELELELKKKSEEASDLVVQIELLRNEMKNQALDERKRTEDEENINKIKDLELEIELLTKNKRDLEEKIKNTIDESNLEKEKMNGKINELQAALLETENQLCAERQKFKDSQEDVSSETKYWMEQVEILDNRFNTLQAERKGLETELESLRNEKQELELVLEKERQEGFISKSHIEKKNIGLTNKISEQEKTLLEMGEAMNKLKSENLSLSQTKFLESKSNINLVERKIEEMSDELRKQFEDKYRILSRRIRVAEQLHMENKEWYRKTKDAYEQETKDLKELLERSEFGLKHVKNMSLAANDVLASLDPVALRFEECTANFMNRISKASCELKFTKDWAMRKNRVILHVKDEMDCLLAQLDDKEKEILVYREKVWKSENKVRELEKMIKENEDGVLVLKEEKREAIRQLCVWIDYHRSRSDYYKKTLSEMNLGRRKTS